LLNPNRDATTSSIKPLRSDCRGFFVLSKPNKSQSYFFGVERKKSEIEAAASNRRNGTEYEVKAGDVLLVPSGSKHNVINTGADDLKMYTIYALPNHKDGIVRASKEDASKHEAKFDGKTTE